MLRHVFLFPGQGAQYVGMAKELVSAQPDTKTWFDRASEVLGYDLLDVCSNGPAEKLNTTAVSQPAIFVASLAALETLRPSLPINVANESATAGLSLGEYTALVFSGAMSFEDGIQVVKARGEAMQAAAEATAGGMVAILGLEAAEVEALVAEARQGGVLEVANYLCPGNTVVSGETAQIERLCALAEARQFRTAKLAVAGAFHTSLMKPADTLLEAALANVTLQKATVPVWSNVDAQPHTDPARIKELLVQQVLSPVRWEETLRGLLAAGAEQFYEIGPGRVLAGLLKRVDRKASLKNIPA